MISATFLLSSLAVIVSPGPDAALILHQVLAHESRRPALLTAAGMLAAGCVHAVAAVTGAALILRTRPDLLTALELTGAALLIGWGVAALRGWPAHGPAGGPATAPLRARSFAAGFLSTIANPKVSLFLIVFLPHFLPPGSRGASALAMLAGVYLALGSCWLVTLTAVAGRLRERLTSPALRRRLQLATGVAFIAVGVRLAVGA